MARRFPARRWILPLLLACASTLPAPAARPGDPIVSIPVNRLGFEVIPPRYLVGGATMFTLHFVDSTHLLFTFNSRGLLTRLPDPQPDDDDRNVTAVLLELPSGKVLARTLWRTRDREQYLWPLAHGRFLLRIRSRLSVLDPLTELAAGDAFRQIDFLDFKRRIGYVSVSPGGDLLTVETAPPRQPDRGPQLPLPSPTASPQSPAPTAPPVQAVHVEIDVEPSNRPPIELRFFRLRAIEEPGHPPRLIAAAAGTLGSRSLITVPATAEGFLDSVKESANTWDFDFLSHAGKKIELAPYDSTCTPRPYFISRSEFIAFGCRGSTDKGELSGFNLRAEQPWIQIISNSYIAPFLVTAPAAGRFALSRITTSGTFFDPENIVPDELLSQDIVVFQHHDGRTLFKVQATPIQRSGQNFDISSDGLLLTVLRGGNIEVYQLPALSAKDRQEVQLAATAAPEPNDAPIHLKSEPLNAPARSAAAAVRPAQPTPSVTPTAPPADPAQLDPATPTPSEPTDPVDIVNNLSFGPGPAPTPAKPATAPKPPPPNPAPDPAAPPDPSPKPPTLFDPDHPKPPQ